MTENLPPMDFEEEYREILAVIRENGGEIEYKALNDILSERFEGVRLRLKTMKDKKLVDFEGMVPGFSAMITLGENADTIK
ncbi:MAG: hypothetical protein ACW99A_12100 [Candidatus Kariarchaeaceae archaeon]|jgi:hypothetical protein